MSHDWPIHTGGADASKTGHASAIDVTNPPAPYAALDNTGTNDVSADLQRMIDGVPPGELHFPTGRYRIENTLVIPASKCH